MNFYQIKIHDLLIILKQYYSNAIVNIILEPKILSVVKGDNNYGIEFTELFINKDGMFYNGYNITYVP